MPPLMLATGFVFLLMWLDGRAMGQEVIEAYAGTGRPTTTPNAVTNTSAITAMLREPAGICNDQVNLSLLSAAACRLTHCSCGPRFRAGLNLAVDVWCFDCISVMIATHDGSQSCSHRLLC